VNPSTPGLRVGFVPDPALAGALCRAWNDWAADHCEASGGRVYANLILPWQDVDLARAELDRASQRRCFRGVIMRPAPAYPNGFVGDAVFDPLYAAIAERDLVLVFHTGTFREGPLADITSHFAGFRPSWHATFYGLMFAFPLEAWTAYAQLVFEGALDRHPSLRVMLTESHGGWMVTALERMDEYARGGEQLRAAYQMRLDLLPSEYFARQGFVVFEGDEVALGFASEHIGASMVWASDYPHADATFPGGADAFRANLAKLPESVQRGVAWENGARAFALDPARFA
ncbi:MAG: amidohydrolase family protein, partial [Acidimicrobiia bacterium]